LFKIQINVEWIKMSNKVVRLTFLVVFVGSTLLGACQSPAPTLPTPATATASPTLTDTLPTKVVLAYGGPVGDAKVASEILKEAYQQLGIEVVIKVVPQARSLILSNEGEIDGEIARINGLEAQYPNLVRVPVVLIEQEGMAFVRKEKAFPLKGWDSLRPYSIVAMNGVKWSTDGTQGMDRVVMVTQPEQVFQMLETGRAEVALGPRLSGLLQIKRLGFTDLQALEPPLVVNELYHYLNNKHSAVLLPRITAVLQQMEASGRLREIREQTIAAMLDQ
jgi:polar amino acid transport system substrate-binding protein